MANTINLSARATEQDIQTALSSAPDGSIIKLAANQVIPIASGLVLDVAKRSITFDLNGSRLQQAGDVNVLVVRGAHAPEQQAVLGERNGAVTVTYSGASQLAPGDWVKIYSDDSLPNDQGAVTRLGQAMQVAAVDGSTLLLRGHLEYAAKYQTNVRASAFESGTATVMNGTIRGDQTYAQWNADLLLIRSAVGAQVDRVIVRDGNSTGINVVDGVKVEIRQSAAFNLSDNVSSGERGYGIHSAGSFATYVDGFYAERVRHAVDNNAVGLSSTSPDPSKYGADFNLAATNIVVNGATATAFSWHSEGRLSTFKDSVVINSWGVLGARGVSNAMRDVAGAYNERGIQFYEYGDGDSRDIKVSNLRISDLSYYAFANLRDPRSNVVSDSWFEVSGLDRFAFEGIEARGTAVLGGSGSHSRLLGGAGADRLLGTRAADSIQGQVGDDYIWGAEGADRLTGGAGADRFAYFATDEAGDVITDFAAAAGDTLDLSVLALRMGWRGDLVAKGLVSLHAEGIDTVVRLSSGSGSVELVTILNVSPASVAARLSTDIVVTDRSSAGPDRLTNSPDSPMQVIGGSGNDLLFDTNVGGRLSGGAGDDRLFDLGGDATFIGGEGRDSVSYRYAASKITVDLADFSINTGAAAGDRFSQVEGIEGSDFADRLSGNGGTNSLYGRDGNDVISGGAGVDYLDGGKGNDVLRGGSENDEIRAREGSDRVYGDAGNDVLDGGAGNDVVYGGDGNDRFDDYGGADTFYGGGGRDVFVFGNPAAGVDRIADFAHGKDYIELPTVHLGLAAGTQLVLVSASSEVSPEGPFLTYDQKAGELTYRHDVHSDSMLVFYLSGSPTLTSADIIFV